MPAMPCAQRKFHSVPGFAHLFASGVDTKEVRNRMGLGTRRMCECARLLRGQIEFYSKRPHSR